MEIKKYFYTEHKKTWDAHMLEMREAVQEQAQWEQECFQGMTPKEQDEIQRKRLEVIVELMEELLPIQEEVYTIINMPKYNLFCKLAEESILFAEYLCANLWVDVEDLSGSIILVGEELNHTGERKSMMQKLAEAADEVHMKVSVDTGQGEPTDVDGLVQIEYWFDFYIEVEK